MKTRQNSIPPASILSHFPLKEKKPEAIARPQSPRVNTGDPICLHHPHTWNLMKIPERSCKNKQKLQHQQMPAHSLRFPLTPRNISSHACQQSEAVFIFSKATSSTPSTTLGGHYCTVDLTDTLSQGHCVMGYAWKEAISTHTRVWAEWLFTESS